MYNLPRFNETKSHPSKELTQFAIATAAADKGNPLLFVKPKKFSIRNRGCER